LYPYVKGSTFFGGANFEVADPITPIDYFALNPELARLNGKLTGLDNDPKFPNNLPYTQLVSRRAVPQGLSTQSATGWAYDPNLGKYLYTPGDFIVPLFSQLGLDVNPNDDVANPINRRHRLVPNLQISPPISVYEISTRWHVDYLDDPCVRDFIWRKIVGRSFLQEEPKFSCGVEPFVWTGDPGVTQE